MTAAAILALVEAAAPEIKDLVVAILQAHKDGDAAAQRAAIEAGLRLQFVARQELIASGK